MTSASAFPDTVRAIIRARSAGGADHGPGRCELCGRPGFHDCHHRAARKAGGSADAELATAANGLHLCRWCHDDVERHPEASELYGWKVRTGNDPAARRVWLRSIYCPTGCYVVLDAAGCFTFVDVDECDDCPSPPQPRLRGA